MVPGTDADSALRALTWTRNELSTVGSGDVATVHTAYLRWANAAAESLGHTLSGADVDRLVLTARHWALQSQVPGPNSALMSLVQLEIREAGLRIDAAVAGVNQAYGQWKNTPGKLVVPDTNVYLHHRLELDEMDWAGMASARNHVQVNLVVPMLVVDELDRHKRTNQRTRARSALRRFNELFSDRSLAATLSPQSGSAGRVMVHLLLDDARHVRLPHPDSELVDRVQALASLTGRVVSMVTFDTAMALRAHAAGIDVFHLDPDDEKPS